MVRRMTVLVAAVLLAATACSSGQQAAENRQGQTGFVSGNGRVASFPPGERAAAPDFGGTTLDGKPWKLADVKGKVVVLNVWGSWCGPCRQEMPILVRAAQRRPDVRFLGLDVQDNDAAGRAFEQEFGVPYPSISDPARELASRLGAVATPSTFVVDASGVIRARVLGIVKPDTLECMIGLVTSG